MGRTPNSTRTISTTPWKAPATPPRKPKLPRKTLPRRRSGERNECGEAHSLWEGPDQSEGIYPNEEADDAPRELSSARRGATFSAGFYTPWLRRPSSALPRRVLPVRKFGAHYSPPRRRIFRPILRSVAARS